MKRKRRISFGNSSSGVDDCLVFVFQTSEHDSSDYGRQRTRITKMNRFTPGMPGIRPIRSPSTPEYGHRKRFSDDVSVKTKRCHH